MWIIIKIADILYVTQPGAGTSRYSKLVYLEILGADKDLSLCIPVPHFLTRLTFPLVRAHGLPHRTNRTMPYLKTPLSLAPSFEASNRSSVNPQQNPQQNIHLIFGIVLPCAVHPRHTCTHVPAHTFLHTPRAHTRPSTENHGIPRYLLQLSEVPTTKQQQRIHVPTCLLTG